MQERERVREMEMEREEGGRERGREEEVPVVKAVATPLGLLCWARTPVMDNADP